MSKRNTAATLFALLWTAYMADAFFTQSGLYALAVSLQSSVFGAYDPILTGSLLWIIPVSLVGMNMPKGYETPVNFDLATLGDNTPPRGRVLIEGNVLTDAMISFEENSDGTIRLYSFAPMIAFGTANTAGSEAAPFRFFQKVETYDSQPGPDLFDRIGYLRAQALSVRLI